jgi:hypothetical protein
MFFVCEFETSNVTGYIMLEIVVLCCCLPCVSTTLASLYCSVMEKNSYRLSGRLMCLIIERD